MNLAITILVVCFTSVVTFCLFGSIALMILGAIIALVICLVPNEILYDTDEFYFPIDGEDD